MATLFIMHACVVSSFYAAKRSHYPAARQVNEMHQAIFMTLLAIFNLDVFIVTTLPAQFMIIMFCFTILIMVRYHAPLQ